MATTGALAHKVTTLTAGVGLTQEQIGQIVDASPRSVLRWSTGQVVPQRLNRQRLVELAYVAEAATEVMPAQTANEWMFTPNRMLAHDTPAARIHDGGYKDVMDLIEAVADGVVM